MSFRLCRHWTDPRGSLGHPHWGGGWSWEFLGATKWQPQQVFSEWWLDDPVEWRVQSSWDSIHLWEDRTSGEPDVSWAHHGTTVDSGRINTFLFMFWVNIVPLWCQSMLKRTEVNFYQHNNKAHVVTTQNTKVNLTNVNQTDSCQQIKTFRILMYNVQLTWRKS